MSVCCLSVPNLRSQSPSLLTASYYIAWLAARSFSFSVPNLRSQSPTLMTASYYIAWLAARSFSFSVPNLHSQTPSLLTASYYIGWLAACSVSFSVPNLHRCCLQPSSSVRKENTHIHCTVYSVYLVVSIANTAMCECIKEKPSESGVSVEACAPRRFQPQALLPDAENLALWATFF